MKWLTILFALYLLTLSCVPCLCADACKLPAENTAAAHAPQKQADDNCTPFCTFSCCPVGAVSIKHTLEMDKPSGQIARQAFPLFNPAFSSYNSHSIWQPPKLNC